MTPALETCVTWKWSTPGYRSTFTADAVNTLARMVRRHYHRPIRFVCVTNDAKGIDSTIEVQPDREDFSGVPSPHGAKNPSCYRRLRLFHPAAAQWFGQRYVSIDLDTVIVDDLSPVWDRNEDVVFWGDTNPMPGSHYNGSMMLMTAGSRPQVWTKFNPQTSPFEAMRAKCYGSDQGWISYCLGDKETRWTRDDGVYSFRNDIAKNLKFVPKNARVVFFHGSQDPWSEYVQNNCAWVRKYYS